MMQADMTSERAYRAHCIVTRGVILGSMNLESRYIMAALKIVSILQASDVIKCLLGATPNKGSSFWCAVNIVRI